MAGKWGSSGGGGLGLPAGSYTVQIVDVKTTVTKDFNDKTKDVEQFEWSVDIWVGNEWKRKKIWTKTGFQDPAGISDPKFTPKLMRLVRACGMPLPRTKDEAESWQESSLCGKRFQLQLQANPEDPSKLAEYFTPVPGAAAPAPAPVAASAAAPPPPAPMNEPDAPALAGVGAGNVAGDEDLWK